MKNYILLLIAFIVTIHLHAQKTTTIADFGSVFNIENPDLVLQKDKVYKAIFDVFIDGKKKNKKNSSIVTVAR